MKEFSECFIGIAVISKSLGFFVAINHIEFDIAAPPKRYPLRIFSLML